MNELLRFDKTKKLLMLDVETFSLCLSFVNNRFWQWGHIQIQGDKILLEEEFYVKWPDCDLKISEDAARITRYSQQIFDAKCVPENDIFNHIYDLIENSDYICGHNVLFFDLYLISEWYKMHGKNPRNLAGKIIDTNCLAKGLKIGYHFDRNKHSLLEYQYQLAHKRVKGVKTSLGFLAKEYDLKFDENTLHDALQDLRVNIQLWNKLKWSIEI